jgi:endonuclease III
MRERFPTWEQVRDASEADLVDALRPGGLANSKAPRIQHVLRSIGPLDLESLSGRDPDEAMAWLVRLPGVGVKTASCVLLFSLSVPVMPVDRHVYRVTSRLELIPRGTAAERAHVILTDLTPPELMLEAHLLLITHGRRTCLAPRPRCADCVVLAPCPCGKRRLETGGGQ